MKTTSKTLYAISTALLTGCGGGSDNTSSPAPVSEPASTFGKSKRERGPLSG